MGPKQRLEIASQQLDRVLGFFARVEGKASFVFAIDSALLGLIAINLQRDDLTNWVVMTPAAICVVLLCVSLFYIYRCSFPYLAGGQRSLIYFREIASLREVEFIERVSKIEEEAYATDMLGQVWRNSEILSKKFNAIKAAFILTAISLAPWFVFLAVTSVVHPHLVSFR
jgi:hypothetical protein